MTRAVRRYVVLLALLFWQGGFTFYSAVVVPIGTEILGSAEEQGWITRRVTKYLNLAGAIAVAALGWDIAVGGDPNARRRQLRWLAWCVLAVTLILLVWLHVRLEAFLDLERSRIINRRSFRSLHKSYLWISTVQWGCALAILFLTLRAWQGEDGQENAGSSVSVQPGDRG